MTDIYQAGSIKAEFAGKSDQKDDKLNDCMNQPCPQCRQGIMEYNGMLDLVCPVCVYREPGGAFT